MNESTGIERGFFVGLSVGILGSCLVAFLLIGVRVLAAHDAVVQTYRNGMAIGLGVGALFGLVVGFLLAVIAEIREEGREEKLRCGRSFRPPL